MLISGIYKGQKKKAYDFKDKDGKEVKGVSNTAFIEVDDDMLSPDERLKALKCPDAEYVCSSVIGKKTTWSYDVLKSGKLKLISETPLLKS